MFYPRMNTLGLNDGGTVRLLVRRWERRTYTLLNRAPHATGKWFRRAGPTDQRIVLDNAIAFVAIGLLLFLI